MRLKKGQRAPMFEVKDIFDQTISLETYRGNRLLISFYRFSSCPFCNLRIAKLLEHYPEYQKKGLKAMNFWQSSKENMLEHIGEQELQMPFIADKNKEVYKQYGVERSWRGVFKLLFQNPSLVTEALRTHLPQTSTKGEKTLIPADFLINPDLTIHRAYYGRHIGDHIPFEDIYKFLKEE